MDRSHELVWREGDNVWLIPGVPGDSDDLWVPYWHRIIMCGGEEVDREDREYADCETRMCSIYCPRCKDIVRAAISTQSHIADDKSVHRQFRQGPRYAYYCPYSNRVTQIMYNPDGHSHPEHVIECATCERNQNHIKGELHPKAMDNLLLASAIEQINEL